MVAKEAENTVALMERTITDGEMLGVVETRTDYNKQNKSIGYIDGINKHLGIARKATISKSEEMIYG